MRTNPFVRFSVVTLVLVGALIMASWESCKPATPPPQAKEAVFVVFEGPWAIVRDPTDPKMVLAVAPNSKSHRLPTVTPANIHLNPGVYELKVSEHGAPAAGKLDEDFFQTKVDPKIVQRVLGDKSNRYVIRLPKPEEYRAESRYLSRIADTYPDPERVKAHRYATAVSLVYHVTSKAGFSLDGSKDVGEPFKRPDFSLETPIVRFDIEPNGEHTQDDDPCETHSREAFGEITRLLGLTLYIDFPEDSGKCRENDPQRVHDKAAVRPLRVVQEVPSIEAHLDLPTAFPIRAGVTSLYLDRVVLGAVQRLAAAIYFFHAQGGSCRAAIIFDSELQ